jgi:DNA-binding transcriptional regulator YhcF (GntR family)
VFRLHLDRNAPEPLVQQAREQIVSALHLGRLKAGERLPSVRSLSRTWGIDPKTAFRIYHALAEEGYVLLRPGSGAYLKEVAPSLLDQARALALMRLVRKHMTLAEELDIDTHRYVDLVSRYAGRGQAGEERRDQVAFIECNREQVDMIAQELSRRARTVAHPLLLDTIAGGDRRALAVAATCRYLVTTDFHFAELDPIARRLGKRLLCVRLDSRIIENMLALASRGTLGMIVSDASFIPAFRRSLVRLGHDAQIARRIEAVEASDPHKLRQLISRADALYVSPLVANEVKGLIPPTMSVLQPRSHLSSESVESIEALLLFGDGVPAGRGEAASLEALGEAAAPPGRKGRRTGPGPPKARGPIAASPRKPAPGRKGR